MTLEEVKAEVAVIANLAGDDERAHSREDALYERVLQHHADQGCDLAREALKTRDIKFERLCA